MKKLLLIMLALCLSISAMAQLNIQSSSTKEDIITKGPYGSIRLTADGYVLHSTDNIHNTNAIISLLLGKDKASAITTINQLVQWCADSKNKATITVLDELSGEEVTIYKVNGSSMAISTGGEEYIRNCMKSVTQKAWTGSGRGSHANTIPCGYVTTSMLRKAYVKLTE